MCLYSSSHLDQQPRPLVPQSNIQYCLYRLRRTGRVVRSSKQQILEFACQQPVSCSTNIQLPRGLEAAHYGMRKSAKASSMGLKIAHTSPATLSLLQRLGGKSPYCPLYLERLTNLSYNLQCLYTRNQFHSRHC